MIQQCSASTFGMQFRYNRECYDACHTNLRAHHDVLTHRNIAKGNNQQSKLSQKSAFTMYTLLLTCILAIMLTSNTIEALSNPNIPIRACHQTVSRGAFLSGVLALAPTAALAASAEALKGTKDDPAFQACLSKCVYECTKPKGGEEQRGRSECLSECRQKCATSKQQMLKGTIKK